MADFCHFFLLTGSASGGKSLQGGQMPPHAPLVPPLTMALVLT